MKLRTAIVEDQKPDAERLEQLLKKAFGEEEILCRRFVCGDDFLKEFPGEGYQVVFLDICMEGTNGIETARQLRAADPELLIVFVTSSPEYVWDAFPVHPFDYLLKPYKEEKFDHLAGELRRVLGRQQPELEVRIARQTVHLPLKKIHYAMAQNHFVKVVTDDGECRAAANFAQVQEQLMTQPDFWCATEGSSSTCPRCCGSTVNALKCWMEPACQCGRRIKKACWHSLRSISSAICSGRCEPVEEECL